MLLTLDALAEMVDQLHQVAGPGRDLSLWVQEDDDVPLAITEGNVVVAVSAEEALEILVPAHHQHHLTSTRILATQIQGRRSQPEAEA